MRSMQVLPRSALLQLKRRCFAFAHSTSCNAINSIQIDRPANSVSNNYRTGIIVNRGNPKVYINIGVCRSSTSMIYSETFRVWLNGHYKSTAVQYKCNKQHRSFHDSFSRQKKGGMNNGQVRSKNLAKEPPITTSQWISDLRSIPNMITLSRIACTPILSYLIINQKYKLAIIACCIGATSDYLDGYLAKNFDMATTLGTYLDPLADKFIVNTVALSLYYVDLLPIPLVLLWLLKDTVLIGGTMQVLLSQKSSSLSKEENSESGFQKSDINNCVNNHRNNIDQHPLNLFATKMKVEPTFTSKVNTALQFITIGTAIIHPLYDLQFTLNALCWMTGSTTLASCYSYVDYSGIHKSRHTGDN